MCTRALEVAEMAKARSFQDLLSQNSASKDEEDESQFLTLEDVLEQMARRYLRRSSSLLDRVSPTRFVFCPQVKCRRIGLSDSEGKPLAASELVGRISDFLSSMELRAQKMYREAVSGRGFDKTWQDELHRFYQELIPEEAAKTLGDLEHLVFIPHHVLHYFPFAALVTEPDKVERGKMELSQPTFLIERPIDITVAPSLLTYIYLTESPSEVAEANAVGIADFESAPRLAGVEKDLQNFQDVFGDAVGTSFRKIRLRNLISRGLYQARVAADRNSWPKRSRSTVDQLPAL